MYLLLSADFSVNILNELLKQSPLIAVLALGLFTFYKKQDQQQKDIQAIRDKHEADLKQWQEKMEGYIKNDRDTMIEVLQNNTRVMEDLQKHLGR